MGLPSRSRCCAGTAPHTECGQITGCVTVSPAPGNVLTHAADGLYVPPVALTPVAGGDGITLTGAPPNVTLAARISAGAGNQIALGSDGGVYISTAAASGIQHVADTATVDLSLAAGVLSGDVAIAAQPGNALRAAADGLAVTVADLDPAQLISSDVGNDLEEGSDGGLFTDANAPLEFGEGLYVDAGAVLHAGAGPGITAGPDALALAISADAGNRAVVHADGLFVPDAPGQGVQQVTDSTSVDWQIVSAAMQGALILSPDAGQALAIRGNGLYRAAAAAPTAAGLLSGDAGNRMVLGSDAKLRVPPAPAMPTAGAGLRNTAGEFQVEIGPGIRYTTGAGTTLIATKHSTDAGNNVRNGTDLGVHAPPINTLRTIRTARMQVSSQSLTMAGNTAYFIKYSSFLVRTGAAFGHLDAGSGEVVIDETGWYTAFVMADITVTARGPWPFNVGPGVGSTFFGTPGCNYVTIATGVRRLMRVVMTGQITAGQFFRFTLNAGPSGGATADLTINTASCLLEKTSI